MQLDDAMAQISDLLHAAEEQKADFQQKVNSSYSIIIVRHNTLSWLEWVLTIVSLEVNAVRFNLI